MESSSQIINALDIRFDIFFKLIQKTVNKFVDYSIIPERERNDVEMFIVEKYLKKQNKINEDFCGKCKPETYLRSVFNKMCLEIIRQEKKHWHLHSIDEQFETENNIPKTKKYESKKQLLINNELNSLMLSLAKFEKEQHKVLLFLKFYFNIPTTNNEIDNYCKRWDSCDIRLMDKCVFHQRNDCQSKTEIYDLLCFAANRIEQKNNSKDAIRIWLNKKLKTIIFDINDNLASQHTAESISLLLEICNENPD